MHARLAAGVLALTTATLASALVGCAKAPAAPAASVAPVTAFTSVAAAGPVTGVASVTSVASVGPVATVGPASPVTGSLTTAAPVAVVQEAIERFNATAGGSVAAQQSVLAGLVSPAQATAQRACPQATVTISMEPVYARLTVSPGWRPSSGNLPGTIYAVPTLIRIYTGDRITGTDLTDLHLSVDDGRVALPAVCLR